MVVGIVVIAIAIWNYYKIKEGMDEGHCDENPDENPDYCKIRNALQNEAIKTTLRNSLERVIEDESIEDESFNKIFNEN